MKRCPECRRDYYDDTLVYCLDDGSSLLEGPASSELNNTVLLPSPKVDESETRLLSHASPGPERSRLPSRRLLGLIGLLVLATILVATGFFVVRHFSSRTITSVAVLPFENGASSPDLEYLSDGLSENLIDRLSVLPQLKVVSRSSSFHYKGRDVSIAEIARQLGVEAVITGRISQRGDNLVVRAEVVDGSNDSQIWGDQFTRKMGDIQLLQQELAATVSDKLRLTLSGEQKAQLEKEPTQNPDAYQLYLKALFLYDRGTNDQCKQGIDLLQQAVDLDPQFADAYRNLSAGYAVLANNGGIDPHQAEIKATEARIKSLAIDSTSAPAHIILGDIAADEFDWKRSQQEYRRATEINPTRGHFSLAFISSIIGEHDIALSEIKKFEAINPLDRTGPFNESYFLINARRYDEAIAILKELIRSDPAFSHPHWHLAMAYEAKGQLDDAIAEYKAFMDLEKESDTIADMGEVLARQGHRDQALKIISDLKKLDHPIPPTFLAQIYAGLGDKDRALDLLEQAAREHDIQSKYILVDFRFDSLRGEPRFQEVLKKVGLTS